jgi:Planctomycete cytochrome C
MSAVVTLIGRLHPLLVHLPIGILLLALLLLALSARPSYAGLKAAADLSLLLGVCCAVLSCVTGYLLSQTGDYDLGLVVVHQWMAISMTVLAAMLYLVVKQRRLGSVGVTLMTVVFLLLVLTGHWGGSITHGEGYLTADLGSVASRPTLRPVPNIQSAMVYGMLVQPVFHDNCYGCHSAEKVKGGLRLDAPDRIMRGGKDGPVIVAGAAGASLLMKRVLLPRDDDHHMAPKDKGQLTAMEIRLLRWWIDNGASFDKPVSRMPQDTGVARMLQAFQAGTAAPVSPSAENGNVADSDLPMTPVAAAPAEVVKRLRAAGALVLPIAAGSNWLEVSCIAGGMTKDGLEALAKLKDQVVSLKLSGVHGGDELVTAAAGCPRLVRLWLDHTVITGKNLGELGGLMNLRYLNLTGTAVGAEDVRALRGMPKLAELYLYQTKVGRGDFGALQREFGHTVLDSGGYAMPFLSVDTAIVRRPGGK